MKQQSDLPEAILQGSGRGSVSALPGGSHCQVLSKQLWELKQRGAESLCWRVMVDPREQPCGSLALLRTLPWGSFHLFTKGIDPSCSYAHQRKCTRQPQQRSTSSTPSSTVLRAKHCAEQRPQALRQTQAKERTASSSAWREKKRIMDWSTPCQAAAR